MVSSGVISNGGLFGLPKSFWERGGKMNFLSGYKTYIAAAGSILTGIYLCIEGDYDEGVKMILAGIGLLGIRSAISAPK